MFLWALFNEFPIGNRYLPACEERLSRGCEIQDDRIFANLPRMCFVFARMHFHFLPSYYAAPAALAACGHIPIKLFPFWLGLFTVHLLVWKGGLEL